MIMKKASENDCKLYADIVKQRQEWFIKNNHPQWNDITKYYNEKYYLSVIDNVYVFEENEVVAGCILFDKDSYWKGDKKSLYLHSFATTPKIKGAGKKAFAQIIAHAKTLGYESIRIDCMGTNDKLISIYLNYGFRLMGWDKYKDGESAALLEYIIN